jgi:glycine cleavage system H protein
VQEPLEITIDKFIFRIATDRRYSAEGIWALPDAQGVRLGVTDYFQQRGGDVAFVHVGPLGTKLAEGDEFAEIETIKVNQGLPSPLAGTVVEVNAALGLTPEIVNQDPYGEGWLAVIRVENAEAEMAKLLDSQAYLMAMRTQAEQELNG